MFPFLHLLKEGLGLNYLKFLCRSSTVMFSGVNPEHCTEGLGKNGGEVVKSSVVAFCDNWDSRLAGGARQKMRSVRKENAPSKQFERCCTTGRGKKILFLIGRFLDSPSPLPSSLPPSLPSNKHLLTISYLQDPEWNTVSVRGKKIVSALKFLILQ